MTPDQEAFRLNLQRACAGPRGEIPPTHLDAEPHARVGNLLGSMYAGALYPRCGSDFNDAQIDVLVDRLAIAYVAVMTEAGFEPTDLDHAVVALHRAMDSFDLPMGHVSPAYFRHAVSQALTRQQRYPGQRDDDEVLVLRQIAFATSSGKLALRSRLLERINQMSLFVDDFQVAV